MKTLKKRRGFTLIEALISVAILGIVSVGINRLFMNSVYMWNYGMARLALTGEARMSMMAIKKMIQNSQGASLAISRFNTNQPANSYLSAVLAETMFISTTQQRCGCAATSDPTTVGATGAPVELYQYGAHLRTVFPAVKPGTDLGDNAAVEANTYYKTMTLSANVESVIFAFMDSNKGTSVSTAIKLSKRVMNNKPPIVIYLKENVAVKRMHSAGYYHN